MFLTERKLTFGIVHLYICRARYFLDFIHQLVLYLRNIYYLNFYRSLCFSSLWFVEVSEFGRKQVQFENPSSCWFPVFCTCLSSSLELCSNSYIPEILQWEASLFSPLYFIKHCLESEMCYVREKSQGTNRKQFDHGSVV